MSANVRKFLDISTTHLPERLVRGCFENVIRHDYAEGFWLWVPDDPQDSNDAMEAKVPPEILRLQLYARGLDCDWIRFDADADEDDNLPTWNWHCEEARR